MNKVQLNHHNMFRTVDGTFDHHSAEVEATPGLKEAAVRLKGLNIDVESYNLKQVKRNTGVTAEKNAIRELLIPVTAKTCAAIVAYATNTNNTNLKTQFKYKKGDFSKMRNQDLYTNAINIYNNALVHGQKLAPFATTDDIAKIKELADQYHALLPQNRTLTSQGVTTTANLQGTINTIMDLITNTIDPLMSPLEYSHPDFYRDYKNARKIVDHGSRSKHTDDDKPEPTT
jgi:hypothetical protein